MMGFGTPKSGGFGPAASKAGSTLLRDSGSSNNAVNAAAVSGRSTSLNDSYRYGPCPLETLYFYTVLTVSILGFC